MNFSVYPICNNMWNWSRICHTCHMLVNYQHVQLVKNMSCDMSHSYYHMICHMVVNVINHMTVISLETNTNNVTWYIWVYMITDY